METPKIFQHADLDGSSFFWKGNPIGVLTLHGFTATTVEVRPIAKFLHDFGYTVAGPLLPGHGHTIEEMNSVSWQDWYQAVEKEYLRLKAECNKVLSWVNPWVVCCQCCSPFVIPILQAHCSLPRLCRFPGWRQRNSSGHSSLIFSKKVDETMEWQGFNVVPLHAAAQLRKLQRQVRHQMQNMSTPTLIFQGKLDHSIDQMSSVVILEGIASVDKELVWMENSTHCILIDQQLPDVEATVLEFIRAHQSGQSHLIEKRPLVDISIPTASQTLSFDTNF